MKFCVIPQWAEVGPPDIPLSSSEWQPRLGSEISCTVAPSHYLVIVPLTCPNMQHKATFHLHCVLLNLAGFCPMTVYLSWAKNKFVALIIQLE